MLVLIFKYVIDILHTTQLLSGVMLLLMIEWLQKCFEHFRKRMTDIKDPFVDQGNTNMSIHYQ
jgi:glycopeptide antibiotics resistance protein